ncbi:phosphonomutase [Acidipropionibacterium jensenii]|uniref:phosphoglucomutase/phosphomannomutase family protein n=1 Tax=Acidipropionibacterium jensenii TaxID=1749 RepID=UPI000BC2DEE1|nr:phosphoglucomutase/phosphomannomutase family protein [Acidipropionibacterium jensenii]AZZ41047.1 phosphonomutase [Acidipropionibacterium jensenii]
MADEIEFGTGGWRAVIADTFTKANVQRLAQGLADRIHHEKVSDRPVVIGYDQRFLSPEFAWWAAEVLAGNGIHVRLIDRPAPTPMIMWTVRDKECAYGLAVTASHNPAIYNGIKVFTEGGRDAEVEVTGPLQEHVNRLTADDVRSITRAEALDQGLIRVQTSMNWYIDSILDQVDLDVIRHAHLKIVLDPMFGVSKTCLQTILLTARCDVDTIHERRDTLFGGRLPSPNSKTLKALAGVVVERGADLGIATDGDADRLGIIDDLGNFLHPNQILVLLYNYLLEEKGWVGPCVRNLATTHLLDRVAEAHGQKCYEVPVGFKWVSSKMAETGAVIGGESSGGLTVKGHISGKDGVYAGTLLVEMIARRGKPLSQIYADIVERYGSFEMVEDDFSFAPEAKEGLRRRIYVDKDLPAFDLAVDHVSDMDGIKVYFSNGGWLIVRFSGTEPLLRVFCEMPDAALAQRCVDAVVDKYDLG